MPSAWRSPSGCSIARYGDEIVDHHTYCIAGDGCLMEGISQEAISLAGHLKLGRLIVLFDDNQISIDGPTSLSVSDDQLERFRASQLAYRPSRRPRPGSGRACHRECAGRHRPALADRLPHHHRLWRAEARPGTAATHGSPLGEEEIEGAREQLGWRHAPFEVPKPILAQLGARQAPGHRAAYERLDRGREPPRCDGARRALTDPIDGEVRGKIAAAISALKAEFTAGRRQARHAAILAEGAGELWCRWFPG